MGDALVEFEADRVVDVLFLFFAPTTKHGEGNAEIEAIDIRDDAGGGRFHFQTAARGREKRRVVNYAGIAALQANAVAEFFEGFAGSDHFVCESAAFVESFRALAEKKHPSGTFEAEVAEVAGAAAFENFNGLDDFVGVAGKAA